VKRKRSPSTDNKVLQGHIEAWLAIEQTIAGNPSLKVKGASECLARKSGYKLKAETLRKMHQEVEKLLHTYPQSPEAKKLTNSVRRAHMRRYPQERTVRKRGIKIEL
jgi:hypothetical protein